MLSSLMAVGALVASVVAQNTSVVVCVAGQCLQGFSNTTIGATLSAPGATTSLLLLPGQYTSTTNPQLLHNLLTSSSATLTPSVGFSNSSSLTASSISLPLNIAVQPGLAVYPNSLYSGAATFGALPTQPVAVNSSTPIPGTSLALSSNVWIAVTSGSTKNRVILWNSVPDIAQLPSAASSSLSLLDIQSSACSPPCASSGVCSASGTCACSAGFTGASCETCSTGFFGPKCQACPSGCTKCDDGINGSGRCLVPVVNNLPATCNCLNGVCGTTGQCTCNPGWTTGTNGTACAKCANGFFQTANGDCKVCQLGCTSCADSTGDCLTCKSGFTQDANDRTKCDAVQSVTTTGTICPDGSFSNGATCALCSTSCQTCSGPTSNDCIICGSGKYLSGGSCVGTDTSGVCQGSTLIADNNKHECDSCGAKCTSCQIPNFSIASTVNQAVCTGCIPGFVLSQGQCVASCPSATFLSPQDNLTCTACDSSCGSCAGSSTFCLTCNNNQLASSGQCVSTCPSSTFSSSGACLTCHPDCSTCSGPSFNQCSTCPADRPVLTGGRCLPTCSQSQFYDTTSGTCQSCDSSCSSCSGAGTGGCLACSSSSQVLVAGSCVSANCEGTATTIPGLGVCLSNLVIVPQASGTSSATPLPTVSGISSPTVVVTRRQLEWWEILLMALGCAFIFLVILMCWRHRARKARAQQTAQFATNKALDKQQGWRWKLVRFGERLFGHNASKKGGPVYQGDAMMMGKMRDIESGRPESVYDMEKFVGMYEHSRSHSRGGSSGSRAPSRLPSLQSYGDRRLVDAFGDPYPDRITTETPSIYSQVTGQARTMPEPRQPFKDRNRYSQSTIGSTAFSSPRDLMQFNSPTRTRSQAELYAASKRPFTGTSDSEGGYKWTEPLKPTPTGGSGGSSQVNKNPFRQEKILEEL